MSVRRATAQRTPQVEASNPRATVFVTANAGSGKTSTLVTRVARLLLAGAPPEAILCVTYTKAAAAEMQRRLFKQLGEWAVMDDGKLRQKLAEIEEGDRNLRLARALFARALETPGGLKIQTIHAFCEKLLRRFPLEAGVLPGFTVLEDAAAVEVARVARDGVADLALSRRDVGMAYDWLAVDLDYRSFETLFADFAAGHAAISAFFADCEAAGASVDTAVWGRFGFDQPRDPAAIEAEALKRARTDRWRRMAKSVEARGQKDLGGRLLEAGASFESYQTAFLTEKGEPRASLSLRNAPQILRDQIQHELRLFLDARERIAAARTAAATVEVLTLARAYIALYDGAKNERGTLDYSDLIARAKTLLTDAGDTAWVLYKLDGGLDHVLLDEAQDTAPAQWDILRALTGEFFHGEGAKAAGRTMFAVGDPKQSIFGFQGAAPERLASEAQAFARTVSAAGGIFWRVPLLKSWRSRPEILAFVDRVFSDPDARAGLTPAGDNVEAAPPRHLADRAQGGCVDLWPLEPGSASQEDGDPWDPVDSEPPHGANRILAGRLAAAIAEMTARGEAVTDPNSGATRRCRYGDVLILVRRRGPLFDEIIRALKRASLPVAGADRLQLSEHGVYGDLMAFGRFARFPPDDLSLAVLLRSPFCDVGEESLFALAHGRQGSLWAELRRRAGERAEWAAAERFLGWAREEGGAPFDVYCRALARVDAEGRSMRQRILTRLGAEAEQALDAFLGQVLAAEAAGAADLETLLAWMGDLELDVKREQDEVRDEVRVMTVHGAKGLEAPIVILPDTSTAATPQGGRLIGDGRGGFLWAPRAGEDCDGSLFAKEARKTAVRHETARLLYVALTRARDRLIVCGVRPAQDWRFENSWYETVERAFAGIESHPVTLPGGGEGRRHGADPVIAPPAAPMKVIKSDLPDWTRGPAPPDAVGVRTTSPSRLDTREDEAAPSPLLKVRGLGRWRRGELIHRLLQLLPDLPPAERPAGARRLLAREVGLDEDQRAEMSAAALGVLEDPAFAEVFAPGSRAEATIVGGAAALPATLRVSGRVDRLAIAADRVLVADFKTNRPAPARIEDADPAYVRQMALYVAVLAEVFPGRRIEAALVWTDGPRLMPVPEAMMRAALADLVS